MAQFNKIKVGNTEYDVWATKQDLDGIQHETELVGDFFGLTDFTQYMSATQQEIENELEDIMSAIDPDYQQLNN